MILYPEVNAMLPIFILNWKNGHFSQDFTNTVASSI